jgi:hypothetical protein
MHAIDQDSFVPAAPEPRPRTVTVLTLLSLAAFVFSYLGSYAAAGALVTAGLMNPWPADQDPRPRNMMLGFFALTAFFTLGAVGFRLLSGRQLRRIDAMADDNG